jgi:hypothetical protein
MTIRSDSYGSTTEVKAFTRHLLDGQSAFNSTTRPTATELERFIDRVSGILNTVLAGEGLTVPVTNSTAKLVCADFVTTEAAGYVELTQRGAGASQDENSRAGSLLGIHKRVRGFVNDFAFGFKRLGVGISHELSEALEFTGLDVYSDRADPDDSSLAQPHFRRGQFDNPDTSDDDD